MLTDDMVKKGLLQLSSLVTVHLSLHTPLLNLLILLLACTAEPLQSISCWRKAKLTEKFQIEWRGAGLEGSGHEASRHKADQHPPPRGAYCSFRTPTGAQTL